MLNIFTPEYFMKEALKEAQKAFEKEEVPVGAVVVANKTIIARAHNLTQQLNDVTAHAEMLAITSATNTIGGKYLNDCQIYITLEPCVMCAGALFWAQIGEIYFGASDDKRGAGRLQENIYHPKSKIFRGILEQDCSNIVKTFFSQKRK
ncbi:MAG TPA: nucleoside deaminase [Crocinitomix sp.]|nr:nucleoside deaminase [Crocinitomix sp.]